VTDGLDLGSITEPARTTPVVADTDVLVVGGGPAGLCAAIAAARAGARVVLAERYPHLGGLASGGEVIVLDDMADQQHKTVAGLSDEIVARLEALGAAVYPPAEDRFVASEAAWRRWGRWACRTTTPARGPRRSPTPWPSTRRP
jgi:glycine/D-amino acid oxidase-like deaminating enzyme